MELIKLQISGASFPALTPQSLMCSVSFKQEPLGSLTPLVLPSHFYSSERKLGTSHKFISHRGLRQLMPRL